MAQTNARADQTHQMGSSGQIKYTARLKQGNSPLLVGLGVGIVGYAMYSYMRKDDHKSLPKPPVLHGAEHTKDGMLVQTYTGKLPEAAGPEKVGKMIDSSKNPPGKY